MKDKDMAKEIIELSGGKDNFISVANCMTRVRIKYKDLAKVDMEGIKKLDGVQGLINKETVQIVVGPGKSAKVKAALDETLKLVEKESEDSGGKGGFLKMLSNIFLPLLPAIIASGICQGVNNVITNLAANAATSSGVAATEALNATQVVLQSWNLLWVSTILGIIGSGTFGFLAIYVGITAAKEFKTDIVMGGLVGAMTQTGNLGIIGLSSGKGGLFGVILAVWVLAKVQKLLRKVVPNIVDVVVTPVLSICLTAVALFVVIMPTAGYLSDLIIKGLMSILDVSGIFGGFILSSLFPSLIATGLHHGLGAVHIEMINTLGSAPLFPVQIMSNAGMVGAAIAIFVLSKDKKVRETCKGAIPTSFLAVGEPCIYGVCIPAGFAFITGSLGAGFGGACIRYFDVQSTAVGAAGMSAIPLIADGKYLQYLISYAVGCSAAFIITYFVGKVRKYQ